MYTAVTRKERAQANDLLNKLLLVCGILSSLWYLAINIIVPVQDPDYNIASQTVSELSAIGSPTKFLWDLLCTFYTLLVIPFGWGVLASSGDNTKLRAVGIIFLVYGFSGFFWPPMHDRETLAAGGGSFTDTMHIIYAMITIALMLLMIGLGGAALGRGFRLFSMICIVIFIVFGILIWRESPGIPANLPTPRIGIWERVNIGAFMLWVIVFAITLFRQQKTGGPINALVD